MAYVDGDYYHFNDWCLVNVTSSNFDRLYSQYIEDSEINHFEPDSYEDAKEILD